MKLKQQVHFGPAGFGMPALEALPKLKKLGLDAAEVEFTYGVRMSVEEAKKIGQLAKKLNIILSVHGPYYINLLSEDKKKLEASKRRILESCERAHWLNAKYVVFHVGYYGKHSKEQAYKLVKKQIQELQKTIKQKKWQVALAPETTGKKGQFGKLDEVLQLVKETKCSFCIDFAHILAREGGIDYKAIFEKIKKFKYIHSHFSGIEFAEAGEKRHLITTEAALKELLGWIKKHKINITIINESPTPWQDSLKGKKIWEKLK